MNTIIEKNILVTTASFSLIPGVVHQLFREAGSDYFFTRPLVQQDENYACQCILALLLIEDMIRMAFDMSATNSK